MGFLSTFWSFGYTRLSLKLKAFLDAASVETAPKIRRSDVINMLEKVRQLLMCGFARGASIYFASWRTSFVDCGEAGRYHMQVWYAIVEGAVGLQAASGSQRAYNCFVAFAGRHHQCLGCGGNVAWAASYDRPFGGENAYQRYSESLHGHKHHGMESSAGI